MAQNDTERDPVELTEADEKAIANKDDEQLVTVTLKTGTKIRCTKALAATFSAKPKK